MHAAVHGEVFGDKQENTMSDAGIHFQYALKFSLRRRVNIIQHTTTKQSKFLDMFIVWYTGRPLRHKGRGKRAYAWS